MATKGKQSTKSASIKQTKRFESLATKAVEAIRALEQTLPLSDLTERERHMALGLMHVPTAVLGDAADILEKDGDKFPGFDASLLRDAQGYETAMRGIASAAEDLVEKIHRSVLKRRTPAIQASLDLYAATKAAARRDGGAVSAMDRLAAHVTTSRSRGRHSAVAPVASKGATAPQPPAGQVPADTKSGGSSTPVTVNVAANAPHAAP